MDLGKIIEILHKNKNIYVPFGALTVLVIMIFGKVKSGADVDGLSVVVRWAWCLFFLWWWIKELLKSKKNDKLKRMWVEIQATITKVENINMLPFITLKSDYKKKYKIFGDDERCYKIFARNWDDIYESDVIRVTPIVAGSILEIIKPWDKIPIYLDYNDHSKYFMDVDIENIEHKSYEIYAQNLVGKKKNEINLNHTKTKNE